MEDTTTCSECQAIVEERNVSAHELWHQRLDDKIGQAVKSGIAASEARAQRREQDRARGRSLGGFG